MAQRMIRLARQNNLRLLTTTSTTGSGAGINSRQTLAASTINVVRKFSTTKMVRIVFFFVFRSMLCNRAVERIYFVTNFWGFVNY